MPAETVVHVPTIPERIASMEKQLENVCEDVKELKTDVRDFIAAADGKYASKNVERLVYAAVGLTMTTVFLALLALVIRSTPLP